MGSGLEVYAPDGRKRIGTDSISALLIGELSVGGAGSAKTGSVSDSRLALGTPFFVVVLYPFADREGNGPVFTISNSSVSWAYRHDSSEAYRRPLARIMYGVR